MKHRVRQFTGYLRYVVRYLLYVREILIGLLVIIFSGGIAISKLEGIKISDAIYFSCITGLTIGYGDISPKTIGGRVVSVSIGLIGIIFAGLVVAVATRALADFAKHYQQLEK